MSTEKITRKTAEELIGQGYETATLDYKEMFHDNLGSWIELAKDVYGMANSGGGHIVIGVEDGTFNPKGLDTSFHIDAQNWTSKLSKWVNQSVNIDYYEHTTQIENQPKKFPILKIHGSTTLLIPTEDGVYSNHHRRKVGFQKGVLYIRENTSTIAATSAQYTRLVFSMVARRAATTGSDEIPFSTISLFNNKSEPDLIQENIWSNLFPVEEMPDHVYTASTNYSKADDIYKKISFEMLRQEKSYNIPAFFLNKNHLYSFVPFNQFNPLIYCISSNQTIISSSDWLQEKKKHNHLIMLLNYSLKKFCYTRKFIYDSSKDRYYTRLENDNFPRIEWIPYKRHAVRRLIAKKKNQQGTVMYYEHFAAKMKFMILGNNLFLLLEPHRVFTKDGETPLDQKQNTRISTRKNSLYHNNNYLYDLKFILHLFATTKNKIEIGSSNSQIVVNLEPLDSRVDFGISNDQNTGGDFLDSLESDPLKYDIIEEEEAPFDANPLTQTSLEESN